MQNHIVIIIVHTADTYSSAWAFLPLIFRSRTCIYRIAADVEELVSMFLNTNTYNEDISLVDTNGIVLYSTNSTFIGKDLSGEAYFTEMVSTGLSTQGSAFTSDSSGDTCIPFAIPLRTDLHFMTPEVGMEGITSTSEEGVPNTANSSTDSATKADPSATTDAAPITGTKILMGTSLEQTLNFLEKNVLVDYSNFMSNSEKYNSDATLMNETMESIHAQIDLLNTNVLGISNSISEINMMVNEASKGVNDVAEKNTNIVALTSNTQVMANENTEYANGLREIVDKFKL